MNVIRVDFINVVNFLGAIKSASSKTVVGDRPGQTPTDIDIDEKMRFIRLSRTHNEKPYVKYVPMSNVSGFEVEEEIAKPAEVKKEVKK